MSIFLRQWICHIKKSLQDHKQEIILGLCGFLALAIAFAAGYITARDLTTTPIIIQQYQER